MKFPPGLIVSFAECNEMFPSPMLEMMYTTVVTIIQFIFPLVIVSLANAAIYSKLRDRLKTFSSLEANEKRKADLDNIARKRTSTNNFFSIFMEIHEIKCFLKSPIISFGFSMPRIIN